MLLVLYIEVRAKKTIYHNKLTAFKVVSFIFYTYMNKVNCAESLLSELYEQSSAITHHTSKQRIEHFIEGIFRFLFLIEERTCISKATIEARYEELKYDFVHIVNNFLENEKQKAQVADYYDCILPEIYNKLKEDAVFFTQSDPAATSVREVQITYPGFFAIMVYRMAHELWVRGVRLLPRILTEYAHSKTGIDIHPAAQIGVPFMIDHGTGIVIGETTVIGNFVKVYQGVTLGALSVSLDKANTKRHPTIGDNTVIYSGATVLGGDTVIGHDCIIGGNVWLTSSIEPYTKVFHKSLITVKGVEIKEEPINYII